MQHEYDLVIVGAGMVGASLACALGSTGLRIGLVESVILDNNNNQPSYDDRGITLSPSSKFIFEHLDIWQHLQAAVTPIKRIHISEQGQLGFTRLDALEENKTELGYVVVAKALGQALYKQLSKFENITLISPANLKNFQRSGQNMQVEVSCSGKDMILTPKLLIGADGSRSLLRRLAGINTKKHDFKQTAIVANISTQKSNHATAYERFTADGPIALLPIAEDRSVLVFTVKRDDAEYYLKMPEKQYLGVAEKAFGRRLGRFERLGMRRSYPIVFVEASKHYQDKLLLMGNAAHTIHPNAAQGFNLGLRDVAGLAECIKNAMEKGLELNDTSILSSYLELRQADQNRVINFTNNVASCFYNRLPLLKAFRGLGLFLLDAVPELKSEFIKHAMGTSGLQPEMLRRL